MGGAHNLVLILSGHFNCLADKWQLITGDHMVMHRAVSSCKGKYNIMSDRNELNNYIWQDKDYIIIYEEQSNPPSM